MSRVVQCSRVCVCLAVLAGLIGWAGLATADAVPNGGFDTDLSGWNQVGFGAGGWQWFDAPASGSPEGGAAVFLGSGDTWLYQPGCTTPPAFVAGQNYELSFLASGSGTSVGTTLHADVTTGSGIHSAYVTLTDHYQQYSLPFTATAADVGQPFQPAFLGVGGLIMGVDSVRLNAVAPEPSALVLAILGLSGLLAHSRRRR
jgi:MYXO-CTERM domain-containing protein